MVSAHTTVDFEFCAGWAMVTVADISFQHNLPLSLNTLSKTGKYECIQVLGTGALDFALLRPRVVALLRPRETGRRTPCNGNRSRDCVRQCRYGHVCRCWLQVLVPVQDAGVGDSAYYY
jgi:hypothetical protein